MGLISVIKRLPHAFRLQPINWRRLGYNSLLVCFIGLWGCQAQAIPPGFITTVDGVYSGQSLSVLDPLPIQSEEALYQIRLAGIDAPDLKQRPWGETAKATLWDLTGGDRVIVELSPEATPDSYGRVWAYVWCNDQLVNEQLVLRGHAIARLGDADPSPYESQLSRAQDHARLGGLGIWDPNQPMRATPAEFRQQQSLS